MYREIYIDVVFVTNFLMDLVLLRLTGMLLGIRAVWYKSLLGALIGALSSCLILIVSVVIPIENRYPAVLALHVLTAAAMARVGCGQKKSMLARTTAALYILAFLCGGLWDVLPAAGDRGAGSFLIFTGITYVLLAFCVRGYRRWNSQRETLCRVCLRVQGKSADVAGFYDTGNLLMDPLTNRPVSIVEEQVLKTLLPAAFMEGLLDMGGEGMADGGPLWESLRPHFIVFSSVGGHGGALPAVMLDEMCIYRGEQIVYVYHPVLAVSQTPFHPRGRYQIILNGRIM